jgi:hypothetical protein
MELTSTIINGVVVAVVGGLLAYLMIDRFKHVDAGFEAVERRMDRLDDRMDRFDDRMDRLGGRFDSVDGRFDSVRSDLTAIALAVGAKPRASRG